MKRALPLFVAKIADENDGILCVSLVDLPAVEKDFQKFSKQEKIQYKIENEEKRIIRGLIMSCDTPIYRRNGDFEYYISYQPETIRIMAEKFLKENNQNMVDTQHNNQWVDGVNLVQLFIKDSEYGINPKGFEDVKDGSLFAEYKVNNDEIWGQIKSGEFKGFSLEGYFTVEETNEMVEEYFSNQEDSEDLEILDLINKIKDKLNR